MMDISILQIPHCQGRQKPSKAAASHSGFPLLVRCGGGCWGGCVCIGGGGGLMGDGR